MISGGAAPSSAPVMICPQLYTSPLIRRSDDEDRHHKLVFRCREGERIEEVRPGNRKGENRRGDDPGQRHRDEHLRQDLQIAGAVDQRRLVELLRDAGEISDH